MKIMIIYIHWNKMETKEKNIWKNKSSQYNFLKYIGTFAKTTKRM